MNMFLRHTIIFIYVATTSWAYSPNSSMNRRSMIERSLTAMMMPPSLVLAKEWNETVDAKTGMVDIAPPAYTEEFDASLGEFRIWRRRGSNWLKRRMEREELAKQKKISSNMGETDFIISNKDERQKIQLFSFGDNSINHHQ